MLTTLCLTSFCGKLATQQPASFFLRHSTHTPDCAVWKGEADRLLCELLVREAGRASCGRHSRLTVRMRTSSNGICTVAAVMHLELMQFCDSTRQHPTDESWDELLTLQVLLCLVLSVHKWRMLLQQNMCIWPALERLWKYQPGHSNHLKFALNKVLHASDSMHPWQSLCYKLPRVVRVCHMRTVRCCATA